MSVTRRIYVSLPADPWLPSNLNELKWGIVEEIEKLGYLPEVFTNPRGKRGLASAKAWNARDADQIARHCVGAAILGMGRWKFTDAEGSAVELPTEFNHYEGTLAHTLGLPRLVLVQKNVRRRVVFDMNFSGYVGEFAADCGPDWLHTDEFRIPFLYWKKRLDACRDIFLGYSGKSEATAKAVKEYLLSEGATVLDWMTDFIPGRTILDQIERAAARCRGGVFLFTKDDDLARQVRSETAVPRDNVVFEAGYFVGVKGKRSVLIIRESGSNASRSGWRYLRSNEEQARHHADQANPAKLHQGSLTPSIRTRLGRLLAGGPHIPWPISGRRLEPQESLSLAPRRHRRLDLDHSINFNYKSGGATT